MSIFDRRYEMIPTSELAQLQLERLQALLVRLKHNVRRCREQLGTRTVAALADLVHLPVTTPEDIVQSFPYGMFALPMREVIRLHTTVGSEGRPIVIGHTRNDLAQWGRLVARQLIASGVTANDVIQICLGRGIHEGASGYLLGAELIEASVIAEDPVHIDYQLAVLQNYRPTVLITTPTNAQALIQAMEARRIDPQSLHLRAVLLSRPVSAEFREQVRAGLFATVRCNFGIGEILDPGLSVECEAGCFHVNEDQFLVEIADGELVVTTLCREAMPLLRFRTRVRCQMSRVKCACGRTSVVVEPGERLDHRRRILETPVFDSQIAAVLAQSPVAGHAFRAEVQDTKVIVWVTVNEVLFSDMIWSLENIRREIESDFLARLGIQAEIRFVGPASRLRV